MLAEIMNDPTNMADEKVASYLFMHRVRMSNPENAVRAARNAKMKKYHGNGSLFSLHALTTDNESLRKFWKPVIEPLATPL